MKKLVPDPPPVASIRPGVTHDEAVRQAAEFLKHALAKTSRLPRQPIPAQQTLLSASILEMEICQAYLKIALAGSATAMPI